MKSDKDNDKKIDIISKIDERIIDRNTEKRVKLMTDARKKKITRRKLAIPILSAVACIAIIASALLVYFKYGVGAPIVPPQKQIPIYEGMTVSSELNVADENSVPRAVSKAEALSFFVTYDSNSNNGNNGNHNGHYKKPVQDIVNDSLVVEGGGEDMYYAQPNQDVYITIHLSNPDNFTILSFVLNGKTYASYMFEEGSDMENLILKYNVGNTEGIAEYTIDAVKYVDGTEIKDCIMEGDRTVKVGIRPNDQPSANITSEVVGTNSLHITADYNDPHNLISMSGGKTYAILFDDQAIIDKKEVAVGKGISVSFSGLSTGTAYRYAIVAQYNALDGKGYTSYVICEKEFITQDIVGLDNVEIGYNGISFVLNWNAAAGERRIQSIELYRGTVKVRDIDVNASNITDLLAGTDYTVRVGYLNGEVAEHIDYSFKTKERIAPEVSLGQLNATNFNITGSYTVTDPSGAVTGTTVELICGGNTVATLTAGAPFEFTGLSSSLEEYTVKINVTYDLTDGTGSKTVTVTGTVYTPPLIDVTYIAVQSGVIYAGADLNVTLWFGDRPSDWIVNSVTVSGKEYTVSTVDMYSGRIKIEGVSVGELTLTVETINVTVDGTSSFDVPSVIRKSITVDVQEPPEIVDEPEPEFISGSLVNESLEPIMWAFPGEKVYYMVKVNNPGEITFTSVDLYIAYDGNSGGTAFETRDVSMRDNDTFIADVTDLIKNGQNRIKAERYNADGEVLFDDYYIFDSYYYMLYKFTNNEKRYVSTPQDILNMEDGYYYEQTGDISFSGIDLTSSEWRANDFEGVFNGAGYKITDMRYVDDGQGEAPTAFSLFNNINNSIMVNMNFSVYCISPRLSYAAALAIDTSLYVYDADRPYIYNCTVLDGSVIKIGTGYAAGIFAGFGAIVNSCDNYAAITAGNACGIGTGVYATDCNNYGKIEGTSVASGILCRNMCAYRCTNYGDIVSETTAGAIFGIPHSYGDTCQTMGQNANYGNIVAPMRVPYIRT